MHTEDKVDLSPHFLFYFICEFFLFDRCKRERRILDYWIEQKRKKNCCVLFYTAFSHRRNLFLVIVIELRRYHLASWHFDGKCANRSHFYALLKFLTNQIVFYITNCTHICWWLMFICNDKLSCDEIHFSFFLFIYLFSTNHPNREGIVNHTKFHVKCFFK